MAGSVKFFDATDGLSLTSTDWEIQNGPNPTFTKQRAQALTKDGDEFARRQYGGQYSGTFSYVAKKATGTLTVPNVGAVVAGWHIDNWTVTYTQNGYPTLAISAHKHDTALGGVLDSNCRTYAPSFKVPACFGVPTSIEGVTANTKVFELKSAAVVGMRGLSLGMSVNHVDEPGKDGEHFAGDNYDGTETLTAEFTGDLDLSADVTLHADWTDDSLAKNGGNTVATTSSLNATHHVVHVTPALAPAPAGE